jgi:hypothetical protein
MTCQLVKGGYIPEKDVLRVNRSTSRSSKSKSQKNRHRSSSKHKSTRGITTRVVTKVGGKRWSIRSRC